MNYLLLSATYAPQKKSAAFILQALSEELIKQGHNVTVITFSECINETYKRILINNVQVIQIRIPNIGYSRIKRALVELSYSSLIKRYLKQNFEKSFDAVIYFSPTIFLGSAVKYIKKRWSIKSYLIMRDLFPDWAVQIGIMKKDLIYRLFKFYEKRLIEAADFIGMESEHDVGYCRKIASKKIKVEHLPNWIGKIEEVITDVPKHYFSDDKINMIYGGALGVAQDFISFIELFSQSKHGGIRMIIVGEGEQRKKIEKLIQEKNIDAILITSIKRSRYLNLIKKADAGLIVLNKDLKANNYPGKSFEYMFYSKPIFAYINQGNEFGRLIEKCNFGYVTEGENLKSLNDNLLLLSNNKELIIEKGNNSKRILEERFSVQKAATTITEKLQIWN